MFVILWFHINGSGSLKKFEVTAIVLCIYGFVLFGLNKGLTYEEVKSS